MYVETVCDNVVGNRCVGTLHGNDVVFAVQTGSPPCRVGGGWLRPHQLGISGLWISGLQSVTVDVTRWVLPSDA